MTSSPLSSSLYFGSPRSRSSLPVIQADLKEIGFYLNDAGDSGRDLCLQCDHLASKNQACVYMAV